MWLKTIFKDDIGDSKGKIHSLTFDKLNEDNSEKRIHFYLTMRKIIIKQQKDKKLKEIMCL